LPNAKGSAPTFPLLPDQEKVLVGVALSGGGSRAALFAAGGLEALAKRRLKGERRSLVEKISHISSVSGGSFAASYYAMHKPSHVVPVLTPGGGLTNEYRVFFNRFKDAMSQNFQGPMEWRQFKTFRWGNPALRAKSLAEVLDDNYLGKQNLQDLYQREVGRDTPRLLINSTLYNNGRRLVITTMPQEAFEYDFVTKVRTKMESLFETQAGYTTFSLPGIGRARKQFIPLTLSAKEINADGRTVALSQAVAASASFPPIIGPITIQVEGASDYLHVGDGGLFDNQGIESLIQVMLKKLEDGKAKRALIIAFDSSYPFGVGNSWLNQTAKGFSVYFKDPARIIGIMEQRAIMYQTMLFHILQTQNLLPDTRTFKVIVLRHTDAKWEKDLSDLPQACKAEPVKWTSEKITEYLAEIPTLLKIRSECDKQLLTIAAAKVVTQHQDEIMQFLTSN
jgi:predicted acylesterase/phospholipase RssA